MSLTRQRPLPAHVETNPRLGTWVTVADGLVEVHVGKVELGQGILTALHQVAADALGLPLHLVRIRSARTDGPDQGTTAGSLSVLQSTAALRHVGAAVRQLAEADDTDDPAAYVERIAALDPRTNLAGLDVGREPGHPVAVGTDAPRLDIPDKILGRPRFLTDL
ncbi:MAG: molybdopterin-dependent oxidoreductase, partial [Nocardioidaceae bacterium]|nr:molybdopterin-dependent oxidoreductase [Nocardioidaceae bacterium]